MVAQLQPLSRAHGGGRDRNEETHRILAMTTRLNLLDKRWEELRERTE
jgi:hypothetical protein